MICSIAECPNEGIHEGSVGFGYAIGFGVAHDVAVYFCDEHLASTRQPGWKLTIDYDRIDLPDEIAAMREP